VNAADPPGGLVRPAVPTDARAIAAVHVATWRDAYAGLLPDDLLDGLDVDERAETWRGRLAALPDGLFAFVFELDAEVRGFVSGGPSRVGGAGGEVYAIYVDPGFQRLGAGRQLLEAAARQLAGSGFAEASLWVLAGNRAAQGFYESQGWRPDGTEQPWTYHGVGEGLVEVRYARNLRPFARLGLL
jgi:ribosomal protein S18 acetylase RimI-like enzyme